MINWPISDCLSKHHLVFKTQQIFSPIPTSTENTYFWSFCVNKTITPSKALQLFIKFDFVFYLSHLSVGFLEAGTGLVLLLKLLDQRQPTRRLADVL